MKRVLVIGIGNTLRRDDGVGPRLVNALSELELAGVQTIACQQLTPELAEPISRADAVVFVDAGVTPAGLREIQPAADGSTFTHAPDARSLLALAGQVFGRVPQGWLFALPVFDVGFGEELSEEARGGITAALTTLKEFCYA